MLRSLRNRLAFPTFSLVVGVCALFATGMHFAFEFAEDELIERRGDRMLYFLFDESDFETFEQALTFALVMSIAGVIALGAWTSFGLARRATRPIEELAGQVRALGDDPAGSTALDARAMQDEALAGLVRAINGYHRRINQLLTREREFSADVSHELRTPLMAMQGAAELLARRAESDDGLRELAARIRRGCAGMASTSEALLFLARDPTSFADLVEAVDVGVVIEQQVNALQELAQSKGVSVSVHKAQDRVTVRTVPAIIGIVIGNVIKNAVKYTDHGIVNVVLAPRTLVIQDYGPGIDARTQDNLFERHVRGARGDADGSGIGLALVRRFCDEYGWSLDFQSAENVGTRVALVF